MLKRIILAIFNFKMLKTLANNAIIEFSLIFFLYNLSFDMLLSVFLECDLRFSVMDKEPVRSQTMKGKGYCDFGLKHRVREKKVTQEFINYLQTHSLVVELWGTQGVFYMLLLTNTCLLSDIFFFLMSYILVIVSNVDDCKSFENFSELFKES